MWTTKSSVFFAANPIPGKCFIVATPPRSPSPSANALARRAVSRELNDHVRPCWYMKEEVEAGTSATGVKSEVMQTSKCAAPVFRPWPSAVSLEPRSPICGGESVGGIQETVFTWPPSWSTAMRSGGWPPSAAARWSWFAMVRSCEAEGKVEPWMSTPPMRPRRARSRSDADGVCPSIETTSFCPTRCWTDGAATAGAGEIESTPTVARDAAAKRRGIRKTLTRGSPLYATDPQRFGDGTHTDGACNPLHLMRVAGLLATEKGPGKPGLFSSGRGRSPTKWRQDQWSVRTGDLRLAKPCRPKSMNTDEGRPRPVNPA